MAKKIKLANGKEFDITAWEKKQKAIKASLPEQIRHSTLAMVVKEHCPDLLPVAMTLAPFESLFDRDHADDKSFTFDIDDPRYPGGDTEGVSIMCTVTAKDVKITWYCMKGANGQDYVEKTGMTLAGLWEYLRQIPRPYHAF